MFLGFLTLGQVRQASVLWVWGCRWCSQLITTFLQSMTNIMNILPTTSTSTNCLFVIVRDQLPGSLCSVALLKLFTSAKLKLVAMSASAGVFDVAEHTTPSLTKNTKSKVHVLANIIELTWLVEASGLYHGLSTGNLIYHLSVVWLVYQQCEQEGGNMSGWG